MPATGRSSQDHRSGQETPIPRLEVLGQARARIRRPAGPHAHCRVGAGRTWCQSHGPHVHRRLLRRLALRGVVPFWFRQSARVGFPRRRTRAFGLLCHRRRAVRPSAKQTDDTRNDELSSVSRVRAFTVTACHAGRPTGENRVRGLAQDVRVVGSTLTCRTAGFSPRRRGGTPRWHHPAVLVSPVAPEYQYRTTHSSHVAPHLPSRSSYRRFGLTSGGTACPL